MILWLKQRAALAIVFVAASFLPANKAPAGKKPVSILATRIGGHIHPSIRRTKDGTLVVVYKGTNVLMCARSTNDGKTWSQPQSIARTSFRSSPAESAVAELLADDRNAIPVSPLVSPVVGEVFDCQLNRLSRKP